MLAALAAFSYPVFAIPCKASPMAFYVESIPNRNSPVLLRQAWRQGKRTRRKTIANLSPLPAETVAGIRTLLKGGVAFPCLDEAITILCFLPTAMSPPPSALIQKSAANAVREARFKPSNLFISMCPV